ncbi:OmpP1/FadL family transporter [Azonexus sp.]|uniref:OmpP1/FadL family transporter n=1 Tax=Azonexus sp. TaxID=1872668 RepID=UPI0039E567EA
MTHRLTLRLLPGLIGLAFAGSASASGFQLQNQNAAGTSVAYAGAAAVAEDASTIYFNPAGMTYLPMGHSISLGATAIQRSVRFSNTGTSPMPVLTAAGAPTGLFHPVGSNGGNGGGTSVVPAFYYSYAITPALRAGVGVSVTYGSETEYKDNFAGRFSGKYTSIHQINLNPSIAYKVNDLLSVGFGVNFAKSEIEFRQHTPISLAGPEAKLKGDDTAWGWNVGVMLQPTEQTRVGLTYRSKIKFDLEGNLQIPAFGRNNDIEASLETPDNFSLAVSHKLNDRWELLADATWTGWSSVGALIPVFADTKGRATAPLRYNFEDTWRFGLGVKHQLNDAWNLRAGVAYDESPVPDSKHRTMTVPDSDRTWLAFGARWKVNQNASLDFGYARIFFKDADTARTVTNTTEAVTLQTVRGKFKTHANLYSVQLNYNF